MTTTPFPTDTPERPDAPPQAPPRKQRSEGAKIALVLSGAVIALVAAALIAAGGAGLWLDGKKDADGFVSTGDHRFHAQTSAIVSENLDLDLDGADAVFDDGDLGTVRLRAHANENGKPVFVGIARTSDVERYLSGVATSTVTSLDYWPFDADYEDHFGSKYAERPANQGIWAAQTTTGNGELRWKVEDGDWSIVLMNADGSPGVDADVDAGAKIPDLAAVAWSLIGGGALLLIGGVGLIVTGVRNPRRRTTVPTGMAATA